MNAWFNSILLCKYTYVGTIDISIMHALMSTLRFFFKGKIMIAVRGGQTAPLIRGSAFVIHQ